VTLPFVILGGAVGVPLRYLTDLFVQSKHDTVFPWGTLTVNVSGSAVLGAVLAGAATGHLSAGLVALLATGLCGALTTFSTFSFESMRLLQGGSVIAASLNMAVSVVAGLLAGAGAWAITLAALP
jgi:CrcB protein